jgi:hypothetical protein
MIVAEVEPIGGFVGASVSEPLLRRSRGGGGETPASSSAAAQFTRETDLYAADVVKVSMVKLCILVCNKSYGYASATIMLASTATLSPPTRP